MTDARTQDAPAPADDAEGADAHHHEDLRDALIAAALTLLDRGGLVALTLRGVCAEAGVSHTAPRHHFGDFTGLRAAVAALGFDRLGAAVKDALATAGPARADGDEAAIHAYVGFAVQAPALYQLMFEVGPLQDRHGPAGQAARAALGPFFTAAKGLELTLRADPMEGGLSEGYYLWSLAHGHAQLAAAGAYGLMTPIGASGEVIAPDAALPGRVAAKNDVEDAVESAVARPSAPRVQAPDFKRIAPRLRFAQAFKFETLEAGPNAQMLSAPTERGSRNTAPERAERPVAVPRPLI
jgi:AcrR family transcriptional regulator